MRVLLKFLVFLIIVAAIVGGGAWLWAGRQPGPAIELKQPDKFIGTATMMELRASSPDGRFSQLEAAIEQSGKTYPIYALEAATAAKTPADPARQLIVMRPIGKQAVPALQSGPARIVVHASRPVVYGIRQAETSLTRDVQVRLDPPRVSVVSAFHYINQGGSEFVVYRATPDDVESGVRVGDIEYRGYPARGAGITSDPALHVAFFALLWNQDPDVPINVFARDVAGNQVVTPLDHMVFRKQFQKSRIEIDDKFISRVVPAIAANSPNEHIPTDDLLKGFLQINGDLRRKNTQFIEDLAKQSSPELMFHDQFQQLGNSQVEAKFADTRTYFYKGKEIDQQVHLGFDLAVTANVPIVASQAGVIVHASDLGIYGNCVIIDHGMGVQSLYGHLSSIGVKVGDKVMKGQQIGRSGMTGLAGGDHLHFTMLVGGQQVSPVDWWSRQWMQDRVLRKIMAAGGVG
ncbi:MAG TPA: M23 family metallopeptidase [Vicinamibacterales bacterium]|jgi:murein DD-endopeptidase MepM/ murein hydrolase activator NlpD|nr:M23 family metallopeptidase [Vicinamibacterales bacterium]